MLRFRKGPPESLASGMSYLQSSFFPLMLPAPPQPPYRGSSSTMGSTKSKGEPHSCTYAETRVPTLTPVWMHRESVVPSPPSQGSSWAAKLSWHSWYRCTGKKVYRFNRSFVWHHKMNDKWSPKKCTNLVAWCCVTHRESARGEVTKGCGRSEQDAELCVCCCYHYHRL